MSAGILDWWYTFRTVLQSRRIAIATVEECWLKVRSKAAILSVAERADYLRVHAAPLVQQHVDDLVRENPAIPGSVANHLVVKATERLVSRLLGRLGKPASGVLGAAETHGETS